MSHELEKSVERYLVNEVKVIGGKCIKLLPTFENGIPDRLVLYEGLAVFVELKRKDRIPDKLQLVYHKNLLKVGFQTRIIDDRQQVDQLISELVHENRKRSIPTPEGRG